MYFCMLDTFIFIFDSGCSSCSFSRLANTTTGLGTGPSQAKASLCRYLMRTVKHPILLKDPDVLQFLESTEVNQQWCSSPQQHKQAWWIAQHMRINQSSVWAGHKQRWTNTCPCLLVPLLISLCFKLCDRGNLQKSSQALNMDSCLTSYVKNILSNVQNETQTQ